MSNIGPWIDREDKLQWDHKIGAAYRGARNVRNGIATKAALIEKEGYMTNERGRVCIAGYHELSMKSQAAQIEREGYMINKRGKKCITEAHDFGIVGGEVMIKKRAATALDELHTHIYISALCGRGVSVLWENGYAVYAHHCYDPQLSGLEGQKPKQKKGLTLVLCKKCHRTAKVCKGGGSLPGIMQHNQRQVVPTSALEGCSEHLWSFCCPFLCPLNPISPACASVRTCVCPRRSENRGLSASPWGYSARHQARVRR